YLALALGVAPPQLSHLALQRFERRALLADRTDRRDQRARGGDQGADRSSIRQLLHDDSFRMRRIPNAETTGSSERGRVRKPTHAATTSEPGPRACQETTGGARGAAIPRAASATDGTASVAPRAMAAARSGSACDVGSTEARASLCA